MAKPDLLISFVFATHNRRDVLKNTLAALAGCGLPRDLYETIVVDNASTDDTAEFARQAVDRVVALHENRGSCAKTRGADVALGTYVVFLDDDSYPLEGSVSRMISHFQADGRLGAAGFDVRLPDGGREGAALPGVFVGCGVGFRREALEDVGGLDEGFFMQAEEYDLAFRLVAAGWKTAVFPDLAVRHEKTAQSRRPERTTRLDVRNNLCVAARYLPDDYLRIYRADLLERYRWLASDPGHVEAYEQGLSEAAARENSDRKKYAGYRLNADALEFFFRWRAIDTAMLLLARRGVARVLFAGLGKNVYPFCRGCRRAGIEVVAIGDDRFAAPDRAYRGIPIGRLADTLERYGSSFSAAPSSHPPVDAIVIADMSVVRAAQTARVLAPSTGIPTHSWQASGGDYELARYPPERLSSPAS